MLENLADGVYAIEAQFEDVPLKVYVVVGDSVAVIDPGVSYTPETCLAEGLAEIGLTLGNIDVVINTHGHHDHFGGNGAVKAHNPELRVMAHENDAAWISDVDLYLSESLHALSPTWDAEQAFVDRVRQLCGDPVGVDDYLTQGQIVDLGRGHRLHIEHIPAHTEGHVAILHEAGKVLFTGDALQGHGTPLLRRPDFYPSYDSVQEYVKSLDYFAGCGAEIVGTAHNNVCTAHRAAQIVVESRRSVEELKEFLVAMLQERQSISVSEGVSLVLDSWPRYRPGPNIARSVAAQLEELGHLGQVRRIDEPGPVFEWVAG